MAKLIWRWLAVVAGREVASTVDRDDREMDGSVGSEMDGYKLVTSPHATT